MTLIDIIIGVLVWFALGVILAIVWLFTAKPGVYRVKLWDWFYYELTIEKGGDDETP